MAAAVLEWLYFLIWPVMCSWIWQAIIAERRRGRPWDFCAGWAAGAVGGLVFALVEWSWLIGSASGVSLAAALACRWWRRRGGPRRAAHLIGAKSRALRDRLVRRARQAAKPRPVYRPQPQGAS